MDNSNLTRDQIVFRVLLQREEALPSLTFSALEQSIPKDLRKGFVTDWQRYIREEDLDFYSAFQKTVRKQIPGVYYVVMAAEFLGNLRFHEALSFFINARTIEWGKHGLNEDSVFDLAERLVEEIRRHRTPPSAKMETRAICPPAGAKPTIATRRCAFCKDQIPVAELADHIDREHLNPSRLGNYNPVILPKPPTQRAVQPSEQPTAKVAQPRAVRQNRSGARHHRCICCGHIAIPGDFYCYTHATD